jgi:acetylornithine deacetylase/succinyl-diaminopimelate desuccinylase-like protein
MPDPAERALRDETAALLRELIRIDTSNPPGNETPAALLLQEYLEASGVECELVARDPARANLIARIPGSGGGPSLALLGHTDVVPADPAGWRHPPFAGHLDDDGYVWGRGAVDMKNETASRAVALAVLARSGFRSSPRPTRRTARTRSDSPGSCASAPTSAPTTCSTRAPPSGSRSPTGGPW